MISRTPLLNTPNLSGSTSITILQSPFSPRPVPEDGTILSPRTGKERYFTGEPKYLTPEATPTSSRSSVDQSRLSIVDISETLKRRLTYAMVKVQNSQTNQTVHQLESTSLSGAIISTPISRITGNVPRVLSPRMAKRTERVLSQARAMLHHRSVSDTCLRLNSILNDGPDHDLPQTRSLLSPKRSRISTPYLPYPTVTSTQTSLAPGFQDYSFTQSPRRRVFTKLPPLNLSNVSYSPDPRFRVESRFHDQQCDRRVENEQEVEAIQSLMFLSSPNGLKSPYSGNSQP